MYVKKLKSRYFIPEKNKNQLRIYLPRHAHLFKQWYRKSKKAKAARINVPTSYLLTYFLLLLFSSYIKVDNRYHNIILLCVYLIYLNLPKPQALPDINICGNFCNGKGFIVPL